MAAENRNSGKGREVTYIRSAMAAEGVPGGLRAVRSAGIVILARSLTVEMDEAA